MTTQKNNNIILIILIILLSLYIIYLLYSFKENFQAAQAAQDIPICDFHSEIIQHDKGSYKCIPI